MTVPSTYRLRTHDGIGLALHRVPCATPIAAPPVLLVPGTFSTRSFWLGTQGHGLGRFLADLGFDCWVAELRGHGASERPRRWTMHDWIRADAPALVDAVLARTGAESCFWVGHSAGGVVGAGAIGHRPGLTDALAGMVLLGSPGPVRLRGARRALALAAVAATRAFPRAQVPGGPLGLGPEAEPAALVDEWMCWNLLGLWRSGDGGDYLADLPQARIPLLAVAGAGDRWLAPPVAVRDLAGRFGGDDRTVVVAGRRQGFAVDYGHAALVASRPARAEIWPLIGDWLRARSGAPMA